MKESMVRTSYKCLTCGQTFYSWSSRDFAYGFYYLYTPNGDIGFWEVILEPVFEELSALVDRITNKPSNFAAFRSVWGMCCDKAPNGLTFGSDPYCPYDQSDHIQFLDKPDNPYVVEEKDVVKITHNDWKQLDQAQKTELVVNELKRKKFVEG